MPLGVGKTDFILDEGGPVQAVRVLGGPSQPLPSFAEGSVAWRLINQLSLNYLSLADTDPDQGARALRELLALYCHPLDAGAQRQVEGVRSVSSKPITRRMPAPGPDHVRARPGDHGDDGRRRLRRRRRLRAGRGAEPLLHAIRVDQFVHRNRRSAPSAAARSCAGRRRRAHARSCRRRTPARAPAAAHGFLPGPAPAGERPSGQAAHRRVAASRATTPCASARIRRWLRTRRRGRFQARDRRARRAWP
jgi:hypothetical protein